MSTEFGWVRSVELAMALVSTGIPACCDVLCGQDGRSTQAIQPNSVDIAPRGPDGRPSGPRRARSEPISPSRLASPTHTYIVKSKDRQKQAPVPYPLSLSLDVSNPLGHTRQANKYKPLSIGCLQNIQIMSHGGHGACQAEGMGLSSGEGIPRAPEYLPVGGIPSVGPTVMEPCGEASANRGAFRGSPNLPP